MRHRLSKTVFREWLATTNWEKLVLILPFIVVLLDSHIFLFAMHHQETALLISSGFVFILSVLEIIAALEEIHTRFVEARKCSDLEKMLIEVVKSCKGRPTVGQIIEKMIKEYPDRDFNPYELYPVACDVLSNMFSDEERDENQ
jgi:hypothetical protein